MKAKMVYVIAAALVLAFLLAAAIMLATPVTAHPGKIYVDVNQFGCVVGSGQPDPYACIYCKIKDAIDDASSGDTIIVKKGIYKGRDITIDKDLTISGAGAGKTVVDAGGSGRVFYIDQCTVDMSGMTIRNGNADYGGGIWLNDTGTLTMTGCTISDNIGTWGGGIMNDGALTMTDCTISNNAATWGGGIYSSGSPGGTGTLTMTDCTISDNTADYGGGILNRLPLTMTGCTVSGNEGDGINNDSTLTGTLTMTDCTISGNTASGIRIYGGSGGPVTATITNCTSSGNTANGISIYGGLGFTATVTITNCTSSGNEDGIYTSGDATVTMKCTIVYGNSGDNIHGPYTDAGGNIVDSPDPLLGPLQNNGGPTETHALQSGSPAIDACFDCSVGSDQRGQPRPVDGDLDGTADCDSGAYEYVPPPSPDLVVEDIGTVPESFEPGDSVEVWAGVCNMGNLAATGWYGIQLYLDGSPIGGWAGPDPLYPGECVEKRLATELWPSDCDPHDIRVVSDSTDTVDELNETNNERTESVSAMCGKPDLVVDDIWTVPASFEPGDWVEIHTRITNIGDEATSEPLVFRYYCDGVFDSTVEVGTSLMPGEYYDYGLYQHWPLDCSTNEIGLVVDPNDTIDESNEDNNERTESFSAICVPTICYDSPGYTFTTTECGSSPNSQTLNIRNCGAGDLNWQVSDNAGWLTLSPTAGSSTGETDTVTLSADTSGMSAGSYPATITISVAGATNTPQTVPVDLHIYECEPTICHSPSSFSFNANEGGASPNDQTLSIWNCGPGDLDWQVSDNAGWLTLSPTAGSSTGETDMVTLSVDTSGMSAGSYPATIAISAAGATNTPQTVPVSLIIDPTPLTHTLTFCTTGFFPRHLPDEYDGQIILANLNTADIPSQVTGVWWYDCAAYEWKFWVRGAGGDLTTLTGQFKNYMVLVSGACEWGIPLTGTVPPPLPPPSEPHTWTSCTAGFFPMHLPDSYDGQVVLTNLDLADIPSQVTGVWWYDCAAYEWKFWVRGAGGDLTTLGGGHTYDYMVLVSGPCEWEIPLP
jgi:hypothetical protein